MTNRADNASATSRFDTINRRTLFLLATFALFVLLIACGIHGSSTGVTAGFWMPEAPYKGYLINPAQPAEAEATQADGALTESLLMNSARSARWDEFMGSTPFALSQMAQTPRFPVINRSIGNGQNMLLQYHTPVWHISALARPATWGFFFLGAQRGLAWLWWFQVFACFVTLFLLFEIVLEGRSRLAAFAAFWFVASPYVVCWSQWPAQITFFGALACLSAYHLCASPKRRTHLLSGLLLGLSLCGFVIFIYPPWQVPLAYFFLLLFVVLAIREKLYRAFTTQMATRLVGLGLALLLAVGLTVAWLVACLPDLHVMGNTVYPGRRFSTGGDYSFSLFFRGLYNLLTIYDTPDGLKNPCEAASFYYLFPAVLLALPFSRRLRSQMGLLGWSLLGYIAAMMIFVLGRIPALLAKVTLLSYVPSYRADLTIGLASILLCVYVLARRGEETESAPEANQWEKFMPWIAGCGVAILFILHSVSLLKLTNGFPTPPVALSVSLITGAAAYLLLVGNRRAFCLLTGIIVAITSAFFNPLATNLDHLYGSEMAREITRLNEQSSERPFWVCYGGLHTGVLVTILGGKSLTGLQWPPQLDIWHTFDPAHEYEANYNRYAEVILDYTTSDSRVAFRNPVEGGLNVRFSPTNPILKTLGARYVLLVGDAQIKVDISRLRLLYRSAFENFMILEIP